MPRGRPKTVIEPCRYCFRRFKRREHLLRHERTHTHEKPFACHCGLKFPRQDLLARHANVAHHSTQQTPSPGIVARSYVGNDVDRDVGDGDSLDFDSLMHMLLSVQPEGNFGVFMDKDKNSLYRYSSRLPRLGDLESVRNSNEANDKINHGDMATNEIDVAWTINESTYDRIKADMEEFLQVLPASSTLPSRDALNRYMDKYFYCIHRILPFVHPSTFYASGKDTELVLAAAMTGALYAFEHVQAHGLYLISKTLLLEKLRREHSSIVSISEEPRFQITIEKETILGRIQTMILLMSLASWSGERLSIEALSMRSQLAMMVRQEGFTEPDGSPHEHDWLSWIAAEQRRRTLLAAYVLCNLHSIAFYLQPVIMNHEINLFVPSSAKQWEAKGPEQWKEATHQNRMLFQQYLRSFYESSDAEAPPSSFASYVLIHGLLQQIYIDRCSSTGLQSEVVNRLERALSNWQSSWEQSREFNLDPYTSKGPLGANAAALFRLANIRLLPYHKLYPILGVKSLPAQTQTMFQNMQSTQVHKSVLHSIHALGLIVQYGISMVSSMPMPFWTIEHSLCGVQCAVLLQNWLEEAASVAETGYLGKVDMELLKITATIIKDADTGEIPDLSQGYASYCCQMSGMVASLWCKSFQGRHVLGANESIRAIFQQLASSSQC